MKTPLTQFLEEAKGELQRASADPKHPFRYWVLSTFDGEKVQARTVVLRAFSLSFRVIAYTDSRTKKVAALKQIPQASLLFYHPKKKLQIRMNAMVTLHHQNERADAHWQCVQGEGKKAYNTVFAPSTAIKTPEEGWQLADLLNAYHFCVLQFDPTEIEVLRLDRGRHLRASFRRENEEAGWQGRWLVP